MLKKNREVTVAKNGNTTTVRCSEILYQHRWNAVMRLWCHRTTLGIMRTRCCTCVQNVGLFFFFAVCVCVYACVLEQWGVVLQQKRFGQLQDVQAGIQRPAQALQHHNGKHNRGKVALQLHLQSAASRQVRAGQEKKKKLHTKQKVQSNEHIIFIRNVFNFVQAAAAVIVIMCDKSYWCCGWGSDLVFDDQTKDSGQQVAHSDLKTTIISQTIWCDTGQQQEER